MIILRRVSQAPSSVSSYITKVGKDLYGVKDGVNKLFYVEEAYEPNEIVVYYNGQALHSGDDFLEVSASGIQFYYIAPHPEDVLKAVYTTSSTRYVLHGIKPIPIYADKQIITLSPPLADNNYNVKVDITTTSGTVPSIYGWVVGNKKPDSFTVYLSGEIDTNDYFIDWSIIKN